MTTPSGTITMANVATELSVSQTGINLNQTNVRRLAGQVSGEVTMQNLQNKTWVLNLTGIQSAGRCYSAQSGFSIDRYGEAGDIFLTMGAWPTDPPNCQTCNWQWLQYGGTENATRTSNNTRPYWTNVWQVNLSSLGVGNSVETRAPNFPYNLVAYTYIINRNSVNSVEITIYPSAWGTGDTGTTISVSNWWNGFVSDFGGTTLTLTWTSLGY
jgi:hypothetical protein